jgi:hypothetical protein
LVWLFVCFARVGGVFFFERAPPKPFALARSLARLQFHGRLSPLSLSFFLSRPPIIIIGDCFILTQQTRLRVNLSFLKHPFKFLPLSPLS